MTDIVDARGLSCPQPVLMTLQKIKELSTGQVEIIVDNEVSRENVIRAATSAGWQPAEEREANEEFHLVFKR